MASSSGSTRPVQPLNVGNIVSTALRLYGANWKKYVGVSGVATLWGLLPFGVAILWFGMIVGGAAAQSVPVIGLGVLLMLAWIPLIIVCLAYALAETAVLSRLAYGELVEQPESVKEVRMTLRRKKWFFLLLWMMVGIIMGAINFGLTAVFQWVPMFGAIAFLGAGAGSDGSLAAAGIMNLIQLVGTIAVMAVYYWFFVRWFIPDAVMAMEPEGGIDGAIGRSWTLSQGSALRIFLVLLVSGLITLPFLFVTLVPLIIGLIAVFPLFASFAAPSDGAGPSLDYWQSFIPLGIGMIITLLLMFALNIFSLPFWQTVKAVIYCDLRSRREGLGLSLRGDRPPV
jgi:hypothetical protein